MPVRSVLTNRGLWYLLPLLCSGAPAIAQLPSQLPEGTVREPNAAQIVYDDLDRFAAAYHQLSAIRDTLAHLDTLYLRPASPGLQVFAPMYQVNAASLAAAVRRNPERYATAARLGPQGVRELEPEVRQAMVRLREVYPIAVFPRIFYLVGTQRAGGAVQREGVFIAVETYSEPQAGRGPHRLTELAHLVSHEIVHYQQAAWNPELYQRSNSLLARAIKEGAADFIAELISGRHINLVAHQYGERNEVELWRRFRREMTDTTTGEWFFTQPKDRGMPRDLGYYVGYKIAQSRFRRERDTAAGVAALIRISDYPKFLEESGYDPGGSGRVGPLPRRPTGVPGREACSENDI